jgi:hypothetical protein
MKKKLSVIIVLAIGLIITTTGTRSGDIFTNEASIFQGNNPETEFSEGDFFQEIQPITTTTAIAIPYATTTTLATTTSTIIIPPVTVPPILKAPVVTVPRVIVGHDDVRTIVQGLWPEDQVETVMIKINCESTFNASATNPSSGTRGLLQIHPGWATSWGWPEEGLHPLVPSLGYTWDQMYEVYPNLHTAYIIWSHSGWSPWVC